MNRWKRADIAVGAAVGVALTAFWPTFSAGWTGLLRTVVTPLFAGKTLFGPGSTSLALPIVAAVLVAMPLGPRRKLGYLAMSFAFTLGAELLLVLTINAWGMPSAVVNSAGAIVWHAAPVGVLIVAMRELTPDV